MINLADEDAERSKKEAGPVPDAAVHFDAIIGLRAVTHPDGERTLDCQMTVQSSPPDLANPAVFMAHWMAQNWELLMKISGTEYVKSLQEAQAKASDASNDELIPSPGIRLVSAYGQPVNQPPQGA